MSTLRGHSSVSDRATAPLVELSPWYGNWADDDPFADLKADVVAHRALDPISTLEGLSGASGIPVGALARYVLTRWAAGGNEALLELGASGVDHLARVVAEAERTGTEDARLEAYTRVRDVVQWLRAGLHGPESGERP